jgi:acyl carrier protein
MEQIADIERFMLELIAATCRFEPSPEMLQVSLLELGIDSLSLSTILAHVEAAFDREVTPELTLRMLQGPRVLDLIEVVREIATDADSTTGAHRPAGISGAPE